MICKKCGHEISDSAKFCENCGEPVEIEKEEETEVVEPIEVVDKTQEENKEWYYVENNDSKGAFTLSEMVQKIQDKILNENSLVWKASMKDWAKLKETELEEYITHEEKDENANATWYYVENNDSKGPFTQEEMKAFVSQGVLSGNSYVWNAGMEDWMRLKDTELVDHKPQAFEEPKVFVQAPSQVKEKSIGLCVVLSLVTCGLYGLYWLYSIAKDLNELCASQNQEKGPDAGLVVVLSIVTCGIYLLYYFWKAGKMVSSLTYENGTHPSDDGIVLMVLSFFKLSIVSYCILQSNINGFTKN